MKKPVVPLIIHQTWKTKDVPEKWLSLYKLWQSFCLQYHYEHRLWTDEENRALIATHFAWFLPKYDKFPYPIQRVDSVRYFILYKYGGIYSDLDLAPKPERFAEVHDLILQYSFPRVASFSLTRNHVLLDKFTNNFMICPPRCLFLEKLWESMIRPHYWSILKAPLAKLHKFYVLFSTGPGLVSDMAYYHSDLVVGIPAVLLSQKDSEECLMIHGEGKSWANDKQMNKDITCAVLLFVIVFLSLVFLTFVILSKLRAYKHTK